MTRLYSGRRLSADRVTTAAKNFAHEELRQGLALEFEVREVHQVKFGQWIVDLRERGVTSDGGQWSLDFKVHVNYDHGKIVTSARGHIRLEEELEEAA